MKREVPKPGRARTRTLRVDYLARVEGEGGLKLRVREGKVVDARLEIFEPPRYFEAFLRGRDFREVPDIAARICGICPIAYQMSSVHALERLCGATLPRPLRDLRRLIYCGEWIESHALHVFMLHLPDFLGYDGALEMARGHRATVETALALKKHGNALMAVLGGREIHPINVKVGGFYCVPRRADLRAFRDRLSWGIEASAEAVRMVAKLDFPDFERDYNFVAMRHPEEYPLNEGRLVSNRGLDLDAAEFETVFAEEHVRHSNALHGVLRGVPDYLVGPLARWALNHDRMPDAVRALAAEVGLEPVCRNPFRSIVVRALELHWAYVEALRLVEGYDEPDAPAVEVEPRAGVGAACSEAPRGFCWHRYGIDARGTVLDAIIVPPTAQNQRAVEADLRAFAERNLDLGDDALRTKCEVAIRNHDPCISCATHFLRLEVERE